MFSSLPPSLYSKEDPQRDKQISALKACCFRKTQRRPPGGYSGVGSRCPHQVGTTDEAATLCNRPWQGEESAARGPGEANESPLRLERLSDICDSQWQKSTDLFLQLSKELSDRLSTAIRKVWFQGSSQFLSSIAAGVVDSAAW